MNRVLKIAGFMACLVAVVAMLGGHWLALQSVAWGRMLVDFSHQTSFATALARTFSGRYPCSLCLKVRQGWHEEQQRQENLPWEKLEKLPEVLWEVRCLTVPAAPTAARHEQPFVPTLHAEFTAAPPTPPPRLLTAML